MKKLTWEDLLPKRSVTKTDEETGYKYYYYYTDRDKFIEILRQAEAEGKVCLNPPSEKEIDKIVRGAMEYSDIAEAISKRLRGGI
jgi:hypothetical protein